MKTNIGIDIPPTYHSNKNYQMLQDKRDVGNEETYFRIKICCLGATGKLQHI